MHRSDLPLIAPSQCHMKVDAVETGPLAGCGVSAVVIEINEHGGSFYDRAWIRGSETNILCGSLRSKLIWLSARSSNMSLAHICSCMFLLVSCLGGMRGFEVMWTDLAAACFF